MSRSMGADLNLFLILPTFESIHALDDARDLMMLVT